MPAAVEDPRLPGMWKSCIAIPTPSRFGQNSRALLTSSCWIDTTPVGKRRSTAALRRYSAPTRSSARSMPGQAAHEVRFEYHQRGLRLGVMISLLTLAVLAVLYFSS